MKIKKLLNKSWFCYLITLTIGCLLMFLIYPIIDIFPHRHIILGKWWQIWPIQIVYFSTISILWLCWKWVFYGKNPNPDSGGYVGPDWDFPF